MIKLMYPEQISLPKVIAALFILCIILLTSCSNENKTNKNETSGQTIVTVNGDDITVHQLILFLAKVKMPADVTESQFNQVKAKVVAFLILKEIFV